jgi:hypothetical protein
MVPNVIVVSELFVADKSASAAYVPPNSLKELTHKKMF